MKLIVLKEGVWKDSVSGDGSNKRVTFKSLDAEDKRYYYLNITDYERDTRAQQSIKDKWEPWCKPGNVLEVPMFNETTINKFGQFTIIKENKSDASV